MNFNLFDDLDDRVVYNRNPRPIDSRMSNNPTNNSNKYDGNTSAFPAKTPIGMAYVPFQQWEDVYEIDEAFPNGTLFPELNFPFMRGVGKND